MRLGGWTRCPILHVRPLVESLVLERTPSQADLAVGASSLLAPGRLTAARAVADSYEEAQRRVRRAGPRPGRTARTGPRLMKTKDRAVIATTAPRRRSLRWRAAAALPRAAAGVRRWRVRRATLVASTDLVSAIEQTQHPAQPPRSPFRAARSFWWCCAPLFLVLRRRCKAICFAVNSFFGAGAGAALFVLLALRCAAQYASSSSSARTKAFAREQRPGPPLIL